MDFKNAKNEILQVLSKTERQHLPKLLEWLKTSDDLDEFLVDNQSVILQSIAEDLRVCLPLEAMVPSESMAIQKTQQKPHPTVHVDAFLYDEETVDSLCEEGKMSRNYCLNCGSHRTAPLEFISHSFSIPELQFLFHNVLPDLTGKLVVDVGSRLGAVLFGGYLYSAASQLVGVEISSEFVKLQTMAVEKYGFSDRIQVIHADIRSQAALVQNTDVLIMNNVFEYFMEPSDQMQAWLFISQNFRKKGALLVTVPSIQEALALLQDAVFLETLALSRWIEEVPLDYSVYLKNDTDPDSLKQIHLYRVL
uniref:Zgc:109986 n=1 Tax=Cyprinus carpio TaxID=7962 RepID=A0A8C1I8F5_CYPCA